MTTVGALQGIGFFHPFSIKRTQNLSTPDRDRKFPTERSEKDLIKRKSRHDGKGIREKFSILDELFDRESKQTGLGGVLPPIRKNSHSDASSMISVKKEREVVICDWGYHRSPILQVYLARKNGKRVWY